MITPWPEVMQVGLLVMLLLVGFLAVWRGPGQLIAEPNRFEALGLSHALLAFGAFFLVPAIIALCMRRMGPADREMHAAWEKSAPIQLACQLGLWMGPISLFLSAAGRSRSHAQRLGLVWQGGLRTVAILPVIVAGSLAVVHELGNVCLLIGLWLKQPEPAYGHEILKAIQVESGSDVLLRAVAAIVLAPLGEEIAFRGILQTSFLGCLRLFSPKANAKIIPWFAIIPTALIFAAVHVSAVPWQMLPGLFVFGIILGWTYEKTRCLWACILIHASFNGIAFGQSFFFRQ